ncbi:uncharacterized protein FIBRA_02469 [Fibroporia radiculosa]|uniref:Uncharacterized protein n=1 Tax=Fibroporia radiculosa TaxID=599839 RepID=J4HV00_9APHY|nr:uncharacterized protein FIBRA_02469 [Fibroporia radiculosa]CCM00437.1 predicted protein [Fibroporia radiculosa]
MGKWTLAHQDEVLKTKMKSLVNGAVNRMKLEGSEPRISYEHFVDDLDVGDSFTTTLLEVLVKEMADRRTRNSAMDRRLISERTAKCLRMQISPLHIYRGRRSVHRFAGRSAYLGPVYPEMAAEFTDEEDEHGDNRSSHSDADGPLEGVRLNGDLYDAYSRASHASSTFDLLDTLRQVEPTPLATGSPDAAEGGRGQFFVTSPRPVSPVLPSITYRSSPWASSSTVAGPATLTRQNSTRHHARSRTVDFNDFTHRRRSSIRQSQQEGEHVRLDDSSDGTWRFHPNIPQSWESWLPTGMSPPSSNPLPLPSTRRALPAFRSLHRRREAGGTYPWSPDSSEPPVADIGNANVSQPSIVSSAGQSSSPLWQSLTSAAPTPPDSSWAPSRRTSLTEVHEARRQVIAPRLRRGGIRPPESLLSRYASPVPDEQISGRSGAVPVSTSMEELDAVSVDPVISGDASPYTAEAVRHYVGRGPSMENGDWGSDVADTRQLPTPTRSVTPSVEPEIES